MALTQNFGDNFTRANSANGAVGNGWLDPANQWSIANNRLHSISTAYATDFLLRPSSEAFADGQVSAVPIASFQNGAGSGLGTSFIGLRCASPGNGYLGWVGSDTTGKTSLAVGIIKNGAIAGTVTSPAIALTSGIAYGLTFSATGTTLTATLTDLNNNNAVLATVNLTDSTYASGVAAIIPNGIAANELLGPFTVSVAQTTPTPTVQPPTLGPISIVQANGFDEITIPAPVAATNPVAGVVVFVGTAAGGESTTPLLTIPGTAQVVLLRADGGFFYTVKAFDNATPANYSAASNKVQGAVATYSQAVLDLQGELDRRGLTQPVVASLQPLALADATSLRDDQVGRTKAAVLTDPAFTALVTQATNAASGIGAVNQTIQGLKVPATVNDLTTNLKPLLDATSNLPNLAQITGAVGNGQGPFKFKTGTIAASNPGPTATQFSIDGLGTSASHRNQQVLFSTGVNAGYRVRIDGDTVAGSLHNITSGTGTLDPSIPFPPAIGDVVQVV